MTAAEHEKTSLREFGHWRFDAGTGDLFDGKTTVRLEPQVARLLDYFLAHQGVLITRDALMTAVWDDRIVSDHAVNRCISILRQTLSPDDKNAYIETVVRRGFISHFPQTENAGSAPVSETGPATVRQRFGRPWLQITLAGVAAILIFGYLRMFGDSVAPMAISEQSGTPTIAVLPFSSAGLSDDSEFFANGMHSDLLTQLAQLESIRVISRTSVSGHRSTDKNIGKIGRQLGAVAILEGGVQRVGDQIRINVQLIDVGTDAHLWAQQYDRQLTPTNIFEIQREIARSITTALDSALTPQDAAQLEVIPTENMAAYRAYHEALELRKTVPMDAPGYIAALERAVELDPEFVRAWAELAGSLSYANFKRRDPASVQRLEEILERIRSLAPGSSEYLVAQSYYTYYLLRDYDRAYALIGQAQLLRPSDLQVLELKSWIQRRQGDFVGKIDSIRQVHRLDPESVYITARLVNNLVLAHRYDEALEVLESSSVDDFALAVFHSMLRVQDHGEPGRLLPDLEALQREYDREARPLALWEAHIAARQYVGAAALLDALRESGLPEQAWSFQNLPDTRLARVITGRLLQDSEQLAALVAEERAWLEAERDAGIYVSDPNFYLAMALVAAAEGSREETERLVRTWLREATQDLAELANHRHYACRALGMAAAASAAVECLQSGLAEPSHVHPFIEPSLPYYDSIRNDPAYRQFLTSIESNPDLAAPSRSRRLDVELTGSP